MVSGSIWGTVSRSRPPRHVDWGLGIKSPTLEWLDVGTFFSFFLNCALFGMVIRHCINRWKTHQAPRVHENLNWTSTVVKSNRAKKKKTVLKLKGSTRWSCHIIWKTWRVTFSTVSSPQGFTHTVWDCHLLTLHTWTNICTHIPQGRYSYTCINLCRKIFTAAAELKVWVQTPTVKIPASIRVWITLFILVFFLSLLLLKYHKCFVDKGTFGKVHND